MTVRVTPIPSDSPILRRGPGRPTKYDYGTINAALANGQAVWIEADDVSPKAMQAAMYGSPRRSRSCPLHAGQPGHSVFQSATPQVVRRPPPHVHVVVRCERRQRLGGRRRVVPSERETECVPDGGPPRVTECPSVRAARDVRAGEARMRVRLLRGCDTPTGRHEAGDIVELPTSTAEALIARERAVAAPDAGSPLGKLSTREAASQAPESDAGEDD